MGLRSHMKFESFSRRHFLWSLVRDWPLVSSQKMRSKFNYLFVHFELFGLLSKVVTWHHPRLISSRNFFHKMFIFKIFIIGFYNLAPDKGREKFVATSNIKNQSQFFLIFFSRFRKAKVILGKPKKLNQTLFIITSCPNANRFWKFIIFPRKLFWTLKRLPTMLRNRFKI